METWMVTLVAAGIAAVAAVGVAWLNGRGESAELKQLKALNEALVGMPTAARETELLRASRDELATRVAAWVTEAPARRRLGWAIAMAVLGIGASVLVLVLSGFDFSERDDLWAPLIAMATGGAAGAVALISQRSARRVRRRSTFEE